jgi:hypothetical protein
VEDQPVALLTVQKTFGADGSPIENEAAAEGSDESLDSADAAERRNDFITIVGVAVLREMARVVGRRIDHLTPATSFSWLQVWQPGDSGEPTLIVG